MLNQILHYDDKNSYVQPVSSMMGCLASSESGAGFHTDDVWSPDLLDFQQHAVSSELFEWKGQIKKYVGISYWHEVKRIKFHNLLISLEDPDKHVLWTWPPFPSWKMTVQTKRNVFIKNCQSEGLSLTTSKVTVTSTAKCSFPVM